MCRLRGQTKIALLVGDGDITRGSGENSLSDNGITSGGMIKRMQAKWRTTNRIKGVILRIDSPGGDAIASDDILHEAKILSKKKPVVISMSDDAASGGYFIAMTGDPILAYPNTLTGSIGVFYRPHQSAGPVRQDRDQERHSVARPLREDRFRLRSAEPRRASETADRNRGLLQQLCHQGGRRAEEEIRPDRSRWRRAACGWARRPSRTAWWMRLGGLDRALEMVKERAKIPASERIALVPYPPRKTLLEYVLNRDDETPSMESMLINRKIHALLGNLPVQALARGGVMRLMPFAIEVK